MKTSRLPTMTAVGLALALGACAAGCSSGSSGSGRAGAAAPPPGAPGAPGAPAPGPAPGAPGAAPGSWPLGIPVPGFGVNEDHTVYASQVGAGRYLDAGSGPYTIYVDNTAANASDANPGTAAEPLATIPLSLAAGDVVEVHGGPYTIPRGTLSGTGTAAEPIYVRGVDDGSGPPQWTDGRLEVTGSYLVVEGFDFDRGAVRLNSPCDHIVIRDNEIHHHVDKTGLMGAGSDIVFYRNHVHHHQANNRMGISTIHGTLRLWIVGNVVHHNAEDAFQCGHTSGPGPPATYSEYIYIGGNTFYSDRENAVDLKWVRHVVISQNVCTSYEPAPAGTYTFDDGSFTGTYSSGSDGSAIIVGADGLSEDVWIIFNDIYENNRGVRIEDGAGVRVVGNLIRTHGADGIRMEKEGGEVHIIGNTIHDAGRGINQDWREDFTVFIHNNLISDVDQESVNLESGTVAGRSTMSNNLLWQGGAGADIAWGRSTATTYLVTGDLVGFAGGADNIIEDPLFADAVAGDLRLQAGSPALTGGLATDALVVYALFETQHPGAGGIRYNADGDPAPSTGSWQIGASGAR